MKKVKQLVRFDWAIRKMLRQKANFDILEGFLSELLPESIKIKKILNGENDKETKETKDDKHNQLDILAENSNNELVIIKLQVTKEYDYLHRIPYGTAKTFLEQFKEGQSYTHVKKIISITIAYLDSGQGKDYVYHGTTSFKDIRKSNVINSSTKQKETDIEEKFVQIFPEYWLIKVSKFGNKVKSKLDEWIYFLKNSEVREDFTAQGLDQAREKLDETNMNEIERKSYQRYLKKLRNLASEQDTQMLDAKAEEWMSKGREEGVLAIAKNLKQIGVAISDIAKATGLTETEIENL